MGFKHYYLFFSLFKGQKYYRVLHFKKQNSYINYSIYNIYLYIYIKNNNNNKNNLHFEVIIKKKFL